MTSRRARAVANQNAARIREYEAGFREGHRTGFADGLLGQSLAVAAEAADAAIQWRTGYADGYRQGNRDGLRHD